MTSFRRAEDEVFCSVIVPTLVIIMESAVECENEMTVVRERICWDSHAERLVLEGEFKQYYRMSMAGFERLLLLVGSDLSVDPVQSARRALGEPPVSPAGMLQSCISWLAGGSYHHIRVITGTSRAGFYRILHAVLRAINTCPHLDLHFPCTDGEMNNAAAGFRTISGGRAITGCIGAIDGWLCPIRVPRRSECGRVVAFFSGHYQRYGLNVQASANHQCSFTALACRAPGGRNDSVAFLQWSLCEQLKRIRGPYYVVADNAYPQTRVVMTPYNQAQLRGRPDRDNYNYYLSQCRIRVEMAFGLLVNKWRILKRPLCVSLANAPKVIHSCMRLHNFCIAQHLLESPGTAEQSIRALRHELRNWNRSKDLSFLDTQFETDGGEVVELSDEITREVIVAYIDNNELRRPEHNIERRRAEEAQ